jgi:GT2 family glycosyltransferase
LIFTVNRFQGLKEIMKPKISIFWLNFNSASFIDIALESLKGILDLGYPNIELIMVDNCSTDNSYNVINGFIQKNILRQIDTKVLRLPKNLGFTGGNNVAYQARNRESKYVVFLNNDAIPYPGSLKLLVDYMESDDSLGSLEGMYLTYDGKAVNGAGNYLSELFTTHSMQSPFREPHYISYACGTYSIHRISSIQKAVGCDNSVFDGPMFAYYDDHVLGLKMWNTNSKVATIPIKGARHKGSSSFGKIRPFQAYLEARGLATLNEVCNSRYKKMVKPMFLDSVYTHAMLDRKVFSHIGTSMRDLSVALLSGLNDGSLIGKEKKRCGETIDLYKVPIASLSPPVILGLFPGIRLFGRTTAKLNQTILREM